MMKQIISIKRGIRSYVGDCTFCIRTGYKYVWVLKGKATTTQVRICKKCLKEIKQETNMNAQLRKAGE